MVGGVLFTQAQTTFYNVNAIQKIELTFKQSNWDYQMDTAKQKFGSNIIAATCVINGTVFDSVGVRYKGNSSYDSKSDKNPLHIELDDVKKQDYQGFTNIKLSNGVFDPAVIREVFTYQIANKYMHSARANFAEVYINGKLIGLYTNVESINKEFLSDHFYSSGNTFFKCNPEKVGEEPSAVSSLEYISKDSSKYYQNYELKSDYGWTDLVNFCDTLKNHPDKLESILDIDRALWMLAFNNVCINLDSYSGSFRQNFYLYKDDNGRLTPIIWDLNMSFGGFSLANSGWGGGLSLTQMQKLSPDLHKNDTGWPMIMQLLANKSWYKRYIAHMRTIVAENFTNQDYLTTTNALRTLIDDEVKNDPNGMYSYNDFLNGMDKSKNIGFFNVPGISQLMDKRATNLAETEQFKAQPPTIGNLTNTPLQPKLNELIWITAQVENANDNQVWLYYRAQTPTIFLPLPMFDDGLNNDGAANDGIFGTSLTMPNTKIEYYIYAENDNAAALLPPRAEYEFLTLEAAITPIPDNMLVINEILAVNQTTNTDAAGQYEDWLELYNNGTEPLNLSGVYLTDNQAKPTKWEFPLNTVINPQTYLIVWLDEDENQPGLHANFKLSGNGEELRVGYANGILIDSIIFGAQKPDVSMSRCANGQGDFMQTTPSFELPNNCNTSGWNDELPAQIGQNIQIWPNPASKANSDLLHIEMPNQIPIKNVSISNLYGQVLSQQNYLSNQHQTGITLPIAYLNAGMYIVTINHAFNTKLIISK